MKTKTIKAKTTSTHKVLPNCDNQCESADLEQLLETEENEWTRIVMAQNSDADIRNNWVTLRLALNFRGIDDSIGKFGSDDTLSIEEWL